jgi:hypothetical protein
MATTTNTPAVKTLTVQGVPVDARLIAAYKKSFSKHEHILSVWSNAAAIQMAQYGNRNWMDSLFNVPALRLKNGGLSKQGDELFKYVKAFFPRLVWDKENNKLGLTKLQKESVLATHFVAVGVTEAKEGLLQVRDKFYSPFGDFSLTFSEFKNLEKPEVEKEETAPKMTAKAFATQAEKALSCLKEQRFIGTKEELFSALAHAKALYMALDAQFTAEAAKAAPVDVDKAAQSAGVGTNANGKTTGRDTRAGGKVAPEAAAA